ncbi:MAG: hypothetical protein ACREVW_17950, partial [Burkholderiales bacterium]
MIHARLDSRRTPVPQLCLAFLDRRVVFSPVIRKRSLGFDVLVDAHLHSPPSLYLLATRATRDDFPDLIRVLQHRSASRLVIFYANLDRLDAKLGNGEMAIGDNLVVVICSGGGRKHQHGCENNRSHGQGMNGVRPSA